MYQYDDGDNLIDTKNDDAVCRELLEIDSRSLKIHCKWQLLLENKL